MSEAKEHSSDLCKPCITADELHQWIAHYTKLKIPRKPVCLNHNAPFEYVWRAYNEPAGDLVVWASRGGGKTRLAALATLLDLVHKPGCSVRVLGGSLEQSLKTWEHLLPDLEELPEELYRPGARGATKRVRLSNESTAAVLTQSQRAVRGLRVQKLRCDEVELFTPDIWRAAQLSTRSITTKDDLSGPIRGVVEAISTFHVPGGLMGSIIDRARENGTPVLHWCLLDVLERCPPERDCDTCPLLADCGRIAKTACDGFFPIDDAIVMKHRVSLEMWETEMLCKRPRVTGSVFPHFDPQVHVRVATASASVDQISLAVDFGFNNPFVCLWIVDDGRRCHVIDEYVQSGQPVSQHVQEIRQRPWGRVERLCCDPAGNASNDQTAISDVQLLKKEGFKVLSRASRIVDGIEMIRQALRPAAGEPTLFIDPRCKGLIEALKGLRYPTTGELPKKDGTHDHPIDALRYFYVNRGRGTVEPPTKY
jgi:hypothetical protein